ncbi:hypothetical protein NKI16_32520, partial [Mesorhizobium sp. M0698]
MVRGSVVSCWRTLIAARILSRNTQASYRDTLTLLLPFVSKQRGCAIDRMTVEERAGNCPQIPGLRIPMKPAIDSDLKPASHSDFIPAGVP